MHIGAVNKPLDSGAQPTSDAFRDRQPAALQSRQDASQAYAETTSQSRSPVTGREQLESAVSNIQEFVQSARRSINFSVAEDAGQVVVKVTDMESGNTIRQIPSEEALRLAENLAEVRSLLFEGQA